MNTRTDKLEALVESLKSDVNEYRMELKEMKEMNQQAIQASQRNKEELRAVKSNAEVETSQQKDEMKTIRTNMGNIKEDVKKYKKETNEALQELKTITQSTAQEQKDHTAALLEGSFKKMFEVMAMSNNRTAKNIQFTNLKNNCVVTDTTKEKSKQSDNARVENYSRPNKRKSTTSDGIASRVHQMFQNILYPMEIEEEEDNETTNITQEENNMAIDHSNSNNE